MTSPTPDTNANAIDLIRVQSHSNSSPTKSESDNTGIYAKSEELKDDKVELEAGPVEVLVGDQSVPQPEEYRLYKKRFVGLVGMVRFC